MDVMAVERFKNVLCAVHARFSLFLCRKKETPGTFRCRGFLVSLSGCRYLTRLSTQKPPDGTTTTRTSFMMTTIALRFIKSTVCSELIQTMCVESNPRLNPVATVYCRKCGLARLSRVVRAINKNDSVASVT